MSHVGAFDRLAKNVREGIEAKRRTGDPIEDVRLNVEIRPGLVQMNVSLGEDGFIPNVSSISQQDAHGYRSLDDIAADLTDELVVRALTVGRMRSER